MRPAVRHGFALILALALAPAARAHRLDEYLQATFIAVAPTEVRLELCLTPGVALSTNLLEQLDADHDGRISSAEAAAYAEAVRQDLSLAADRSPRELALTGTSFPPIADLQAGVGIIRLNLRGPLAGLAPGSHQLDFTNRHRTNLSVYLVNALLPETAEIAITRQTRDYLQNAIRLDYTMTASGAMANRPRRSPLPALIFAGTAAAVALGWRLRHGRESG
ncbi:MAG TPA: hypothetical protein VMB21_17090 [Candidatus Limnocylindria bacterium]|nr:hypothetical protein [Candidatus Limnocylindria bacterium]